MAAPVKVFISYSHEDEGYKNDLKKCLKPYVNKQLIKIWDDSNIGPGQEWDNTIVEALNNAEVLLFLISPDFMASDYINKTEITNAMKRYENGEVCIVPIVIRRADFSYLHLSKFQALPDGAKPVSSFADKDEAWYNVAKKLRQLFESLQKKQAAPKRQNASETQAQQASKVDKNAIRNLIAMNKVEQALQTLNEIPDLDNIVQNQITALLGRFNGNKRNRMMGTVSPANLNLENNNITAAILSLLNEL